MPMINTFGVIGGDVRMKYLAQSIAADGYPVCVCGLEKLGTCRGAAECDLPQLAAKSSVILLPLPATKDGLFLNAPYAENEIRLDDDFSRLFMHKTVCGGMLQRLTASSSLWREIEPEDYYRREELAVGNAIPTAEGAVGIAIREYPGTINGAKCLITGFGRIGKNLAIILRGMGAEVFCAARKKADLMQMRAFGVQPLTYREISRRFDLIFNTVPAKVLTSPVLMQQTRDTLIIELASAPGGIDLKRAEELHLHVIDAPSLPGRVAPKTAAEYIKEAVYNILEE
ncbi:dipicolinate synthase subunit DpsA [Hominenteromicrobium sp.]|uniref:dipicolinate synthase subunit DpsA n=1 Tax=Hominenteromicrobium sp. TaxID=3073581 RepID=UPI003A8CC496